MAPEAGAVQETLILVGPTRTALRMVGGLASVISRRHNQIGLCEASCVFAHNKYIWSLPTTVRPLLTEDLLLDTVQSYTPASLIVTLSLFSYLPVVVSTIWEVPPLSVVLPLLQVTVVAGPPVEVQVRVNTGGLAEFN